MPREPPYRTSRSSICPCRSSTATSFVAGSARSPGGASPFSMPSRAGCTSRSTSCRPASTGSLLKPCALPTLQALLANPAALSKRVRDGRRGPTGVLEQARSRRKRLADAPQFLAAGSSSPPFVYAGGTSEIQRAQRLFALGCDLVLVAVLDQEQGSRAQRIALAVHRARPVPETTNNHWSAPPCRLCGPPSASPGTMAHLRRLRSRIAERDPGKAPLCRIAGAFASSCDVLAICSVARQGAQVMQETCRRRLFVRVSPRSRREGVAQWTIASRAQEQIRCQVAN